MGANVTGWGRRVAAVVPALVAGCAGAGPEPVSQPTPVASVAPVASVSAAPGAARVELGGFAPALPTSSPAGYASVTSTVVRYGRGTMRLSAQFVPSYGVTSTCVLRGGDPDSCALFTISTTGQAPGDDDWRGRPEPPGVTTSAPAHTLTPWLALSPGRDAVYGFGGRDGNLIERIDERGKVTRWLEPADLPEDALHAAVLEVGARRFVLVSDTVKGHLAAAREGKPGEKATVGPWADLPIAMVSPYRQSAQGVRQITQPYDAKPGNVASMAMVTAPTAFELRGAPEGEWGMAWVEAVAPPYKWPAGKAWKSPRRGRHDCGGGPTSRLLTDVSVDKRIHLTRMRDTKIVSDVILRSDGKLDPDRALQVRAVDRGVEVEGVTYSLAGKAEADSKVTPADRSLGQSPLPRGRDEEPAVMSFDTTSGQGLLVVRAGEEQWVRAFDAKGAPLGEPTKVPSTAKPTRPAGATPEPGAPEETPESLRWSQAARQGDRWALIDESGRHLMFLPGATVIEVPGTMVGAHLVSTGEKPMLVNLVDVALYEASVDMAGRKVEAPVRRPFTGLAHQGRDVMALDRSATPTWLTMTSNQEDTPMWQLWKLRPGESNWEPVVGQKKTIEYRPMNVMQTWGGPVVGFLDDGGTKRLRWARTGQEREAGTGDAVVNADRTGPLLPFGDEWAWGLVPSEPGPLVMGTPDRALADSCTQAVATGPTTVVVACVEAIEPMRPGLHVGLRLATITR